MASTVEANEDDRLSKLPDDVLLNIVERLDIADAARTTILSRRWKQIPAILSKIVIMAASFEPKHKEWSKLTSDDIVRANTTVLEATRSILERRAGSLYPIHLLRIQFYLGDESILIGQTVANTMTTQKVASAELTILTKVRKKCAKNDLLTYGKQFMSFFDACPNAFGGLVRLTLENLRLGESDFPKIFSMCKQLEFLSLYECDMGIQSFLEVEHPQLGELVIVCGRLERVDLKWAPKLTKLKFNIFRCKDDPFCLGYVPLLQTVSIINVAFTWHKMLKLSELLDKAAISNLTLDFKSEKIWVKPEGRRQLLPVFHKLRILNLINIAEECDLTWTMFLLDGAPNLKELHILVRNHLCEMITGKRRELPVVCKEKDKGLEWEPSTSDFKHHSLAGLSIYGRFHAVDKLVRFARNVVEAAVNLEDIRLYKSPVCVRCKHMLQEWTFEETSWLSYEFRKEIPSVVRIHFPSLGQVFSK
ncbi:FBD-associated F-box protein At3g52670-like [Triticum dicoccoides]|uniref:FBD-associated F-box protein At3g52670-like n=1 Tax=Triticum dicoccoides TaxID=85692 RepID=UPI0018911619|nr:FBD-associated F-box protein At3g52670-like [Triticum dicoccoides]